MKFIVWLWNPGKDYEDTRHNLGFMFLDYIVSIENFEEFKDDLKFKWSISTGIIKWEKTILLKPLTYMNLSWESIKKVALFYKIDINDMMVIYDDISMEFWKIRFREEWSAWWHNWIKSINQYFWEKWKRIKVWVWFDDKYDVSDWVLSKFKKEEISLLEKNIFPKINELLVEKL